MPDNLKTYALVQDSVVVAVSPPMALPPENTGYLVVECPKSVTIRQTYTNGAFGPVVAPEIDIDALRSTLVAGATAACTFVDQQVVPDDTHRTAYLNAAMIVYANSGKAPTADPQKTTFGAQAAALGLSADAFAAVVQQVAMVSLQLATALSTLRAAAAEAKSGTDLAAGRSVFEAAIAAIVAALNEAGLTIVVAAPPPISLPGVDA